MRNPLLDHAREGLERRPAVGEAHDQVVLRFAFPVERGVGPIEHIELGGAELALGLDDQATDAAVAMARGVHLDRLEIGEQHVAVLQRRLLRTKKSSPARSRSGSSVPSSTLLRMTWASWSMNIG